MHEEGGVADISPVDRDAVEVKEDIWRLYGEIIVRHHCVPREQLYVPPESSFPILLKYSDLVRETKKPIWTTWKIALSMICGTLMKIEFYQKVVVDP